MPKLVPELDVTQAQPALGLDQRNLAYGVEVGGLAWVKSRLGWPDLAPIAAEPRTELLGVGD